jgi:hydrogenase maturation protease
VAAGGSGPEGPSPARGSGPLPGVAGTLIVGYGNALLGDDGFGLHAAERLAADPRLAGAQVSWQHQLTPELALDISRASLAILVDISVRGTAGQISVQRLEPAAPTGSAWSHHVEPGALVGLAQELYGASPAAFVVSVGAGSLEVGDRLSPAVAAALPDVVEAVVALVAENGVRAPD